MHPQAKQDIAPHCTTDFKNRCLFVSIGEDKYRVNPDGSTFALVSGNELPVSGCPVPEKLAGTNFNFFLWKYRKVFPAVVMVIAFAVLLQWCLWMVPDSPLTDMKLNFVALFSFWMNTILLTLSAMAFLAWVVLYFFKGTFKFENPFELLPEPEQVFSIHPDIAIWSIEGETAKDFQTRVEEAIKKLTTNYVVAIAFRHPVGVIIRKGKSLNSPYENETFLRENPGFDIGENRKNFTGETYAEYQEYISRFFFHFPEFSKVKKVKECGDGNEVETLFETI